MDIRRNGAVFRQIRTLFDVGVIGDLTDAQLLERFTTLESEAAELAFAALVERHGPMVLRVCRNLVCDPHDAHDAFQATFLVLVQKARRLWVKDSLAPLLHRVAHRVASRARVSTVRRREHERRAAELKPTRFYDDDKTEGLLGLLHKEIDRLPERYRSAVVICDLEGLSHERAARQLGWPVGTVKSRLARARQLLRARLTAHGFASPTILAITEAASSSVDAAVSLQMVESTLRAAFLMAKTPTIGVVSLLAEEVMKTMFLTKLKLILAAVLTTSGLAAGTASVLGRQGVGYQPTSPAEDRNAKGPETARTAPAGGSTKAPDFIRQSRGMIISRLEQELALAENRLERTLRRVASPNDPAAVQGRKTVDEIEGLLARIDGVLVDAVDRFPTMFDFSGDQKFLGSGSQSSEGDRGEPEGKGSDASSGQNSGDAKSNRRRNADQSQAQKPTKGQQQQQTQDGNKSNTPQGQSSNPASMQKNGERQSSDESDSSGPGSSGKQDSSKPRDNE